MATGPLLRRALRALAIAGLTVACSSRQDVLASKLRGRGTARTYAVAPAQAWTISRTLLKLEGTGRVEEHRDEGYLITAQDAEGLNAGTYLGIFVEPEAAGATRVTVVTRRRSPVQAYPALSESGFHRKFAELVAMAIAVAPTSACTGGQAAAGQQPEAPTPPTPATPPRADVRVESEPAPGLPAEVPLPARARLPATTVQPTPAPAPTP
jgi:hypothetical protein